MPEPIVLFLMAYAACGLVLSLIVHLASFGGITLGGNTLFMGLHVGIFPLWIPVMLMANKMTGASRVPATFKPWKDQRWTILLSGCPVWMRYMTYGFFIYAIVNFVIFVVTAPTGKSAGGEPSSMIWHGFSGHWMAFYSAGLAVLTTVYRKGRSNLQPRCPNGHAVALNDRFCAECGVAIAQARVPTVQ
ncbi:MAG: hypothetical protein AB7K04_13225 [Pseudorhodoplanes sp.]